MIGLLIEELTMWINKILGASDVTMLEGGNLVAVHKSAIEHGYCHAFASTSYGVQTVALQHLYLLSTMTVRRAFQAIPWVEIVVGLGLYLALNAVRCSPHQFAALNVSLLAYCLKQSGIGRAHKHRVVPATCAYYHRFYGLALSIAVGLVSNALNGFEIAAAYGQVGRIESQALLLAALNTLVRKPSLRTVESPVRLALIFQGVTPYIALAPRIFLLGRSSCISA